MRSSALGKRIQPPHPVPSEGPIIDSACYDPWKLRACHGAAPESLLSFPTHVSHHKSSLPTTTWGPTGCLMICLINSQITQSGRRFMPGLGGGVGSLTSASEMRCVAEGIGFCLIMCCVIQKRVGYGLFRWAPQVLSVRCVCKAHCCDELSHRPLCQ